MSDTKVSKPTRHFSFKFGRECHSFPSHWLYHTYLNDHADNDGHEILTLSFTKHNVRIGGRNMTALFEDLAADKLRELVVSPLESSTSGASERWTIHSITIEKRDDDDDE